MEEIENGTRKLVIAGILFFIVGFGVSWFIFGRGKWGMPAAEDRQAQETAGTSNPSESVSDTNMSSDSESAQTPSSQTSSEPTPAAGMAASSGKNSVNVPDQLAGRMVKVASVSLEKTGWIVIHEEREGIPGNILGARRFSAGSGSGDIELLRATNEGKVYYAMVHSDDGDSAFDFKKDVPLSDASEAPIMVKFKVSSSAGAK